MGREIQDQHQPGGRYQQQADKDPDAAAQKEKDQDQDDEARDQRFHYSVSTLSIGVPPAAIRRK